VSEEREERERYTDIDTLTPHNTHIQRERNRNRNRNRKKKKNRKRKRKETETQIEKFECDRALFRSNQRFTSVPLVHLRWQT